MLIQYQSSTRASATTLANGVKYNQDESAAAVCLLLVLLSAAAVVDAVLAVLPGAAADSLSSASTLRLRAAISASFSLSSFCCASTTLCSDTLAGDTLTPRYSFT